MICGVVFTGMSFSNIFFSNFRFFHCIIRHLKYFPELILRTCLT